MLQHSEKDQLLSENIEKIYNKKKGLDTMFVLAKQRPELNLQEKIDSHNNEFRSDLDKFRELLSENANPLKKFQIAVKEKGINQSKDFNALDVAKLIDDPALTHFVYDKIFDYHQRFINSIIQVSSGLTAVDSDSSKKTETTLGLTSLAIRQFLDVQNSNKQEDRYEKKENYIELLDRLQREALKPTFKDLDKVFEFNKLKIKQKRVGAKLTENQEKYITLKDQYREIEESHSQHKETYQKFQKLSHKQKKEIDREITNRIKSPEEQNKEFVTVKEGLEEIFGYYRKIKESKTIEYNISNFETLKPAYYLSEADSLEKTEISDNTSTTQSETLQQYSFILSATAEEFFPKDERKNQIDNFITGPRVVRSIQDLPPFSQFHSMQILNNDQNYLAIKGSAAKEKKISERKTPSDLDLEIAIAGISSWSAEEINELVRKFIPDADVSGKNRFHRERDGGMVFSLNIKDKDLGLDLTIYDNNKLPDPNLSWATSENTKIFFDASGKATRVKPIEGKRGFYINPEARDLPFLIAFQKTINPEIRKNFICNALKDMNPHNPIDYFFIGLGFDKPENFQNQDNLIRNKIDNFCNNHDLNSEIKKDFINNLSWLLQVHNLQYLNPRSIAQFQPIYNTMNHLVEEQETIHFSEEKSSQKDRTQHSQPRSYVKLRDYVTKTFSEKTNERNI